MSGDTESSAGGETSSSSTEGESTPKRSRYACTFHPDSSYSWAKVSRKGPSFAFCNVCSRDVSVAYGGRKDLRKHEQTTVHQSAGKSVTGTSSLKTYFGSSSSGPK